MPNKTRVSGDFRLRFSTVRPTVPCPKKVAGNEPLPRFGFSETCAPQPRSGFREAPGSKFMPPPARHWALDSIKTLVYRTAYTVVSTLIVISL
jgi:hypothetical protein